MEHPQSYSVTLNNCKLVDIHLSYFIGHEIWLQMNLPDRTRLINEQNQYKTQNLERTLATLSAQMHSADMHSANSYASQPSHYSIITFNNTHASIQ